MLENCLVLPHNMYTSNQIQEAEYQFVSSGKSSYIDLVESAGTAAFLKVQSIFPAPCHILVIAGYGNNGADAFSCARRLLEANYSVALVAIEPESNLSKTRPELDEVRQQFIDAGGEVLPFGGALPAGAKVIVDGLLGTGITGELRDGIKQLVQLVNDSPAWVLSLDVPSGLNPDTGSGLTTIKADMTLTFGGLKRGLLTGHARHCCGELALAELGLSEFLPKTDISRVSLSYISDRLAPRDRDTHKGLSGKVTVIGGDVGMAGAVRLAGEACLRAGAGLVTVISRPEHQHTVNANRPELMFWGCELVDMEVYLRLGWAHTLVIGPGLGKQTWGYNLLKAVGLSDKPCVIDADALNLLSEEHTRCDGRVLTPHSGEAARLLGVSIAEVERDRFAAVRDIQQKYGGVVVLKGPGTLIYDGEHYYVAPVGNPGLASGGCGDVLSGIIGALMSQGFSILDSAVMGVVAHGEAADRAAVAGERGMLASDLMPHIRSMVNNL